MTLSWDDPADPDTISGYAILRRDKDVHNRGTFHTINPDTGDRRHHLHRHHRRARTALHLPHQSHQHAHGYSKTSAYHRTDTPPHPNRPPNSTQPRTPPTPTRPPTPTPTQDDNDADAADTHPDDNDADTDTTTLTPPAHTPRWVRGLVIGIHHSRQHRQQRTRRAHGITKSRHSMTSTPETERSPLASR